MSDGTDYDDFDSAIVYSGEWQGETGTISQQFDNTIHQTSATGATATIKFTGTRITVYQTVPEGDGTVSVNIDFDGAASSISRHTHSGMSYYQDEWFDSGTLTDGVHLLTMTNAGTAPFILDRINIAGSVIDPVPQAAITPTTSTTPPAKPTSTKATSTISTHSTTSTSSSIRSSDISSATTTSATSSATSISTTTTTGTTTSPAASTTQTLGVETVVSIQYITNSAGDTVSTASSLPSVVSSAGRSTHALSVGAIVGATIGALLFIILLFLLLFCVVRRRRKASSRRDQETTTYNARNPTGVSPFYLNRRQSASRSSEEAEQGLTRRPTDGSSREGANTSPTSHSPSPASPNIGDSEKSSDPFGPSTESSSTTGPNTFSAFLSSAFAAPSRAETDAGPFRPTYLSGNTILYSSSNDVYGSMARLVPVDTNDVPPSYQSASVRTSRA